MVYVFETRELTLGDIYKNDLTPSWKVTLQRVSDWRKGIAIARFYKSSIKPSWHYFLIDKEYHFLFEKMSFEEDEIEGEQIERVFGGYYIVRDVKFDGCRTFPGQDRDTEYYYSTCIKYVLDENGKKLSEEEKKEYLDQNPIKQTTEFGEEIIQCESSFYRLDTYQYLFSINKTLKPLGFNKDGKLHVGVVSDYRDFYVVVKEKQIAIVFDYTQYKFLEKILGIDHEKEEKTYLRPYNKYTKEGHIPTNKRPEENTHIKSIVPEAIVEIHNYSLKISVPYKIYSGRNSYWIYDENYGIKRWKCVPDTEYYYVDNEWRKIEGSAAQVVYEKIFEQQCKMPNYIQEIERIADEIVLDGETYSIFKFECRPYGYITIDGKFDYNFDVNNIKW